ncbi:MAG TPA: ABC transporter ATP-binding protein [Gemmatimonadaceae bacterium]|nr:ABC transporter ATP-binding protein [Gemmatimonadaceae bacterium]
MTPYLAFERVWKKFKRGQTHDSLRDLVPAMARRLIGRPHVEHKGSSRTFWALRDLSFEVKPGEVLGIIGSNGAGKSTTLKILNRIMDPTAGTVRTEGRIGALIEVSAGFHQDLTGRQNIFLQGAIMGMRKAEVERKFDEIVAFAGIDDFLDTPVKRYSSGMNARLGFSIAAHLEPDILIIDEVLAVGDAAFQQKAFGRIKQMATGGAPVVLVSHQLDRIAELCTKAIVLDHGATRVEGAPLDCINAYLHGIARTTPATDSGVKIRFDRVFGPNGQAVASGQEITIIVTGTADLEAAPEGWSPAFRIRDTATATQVHSVTGLQRGIPLPVTGEFEYHLTLQMNVQPGRYTVEPVIWNAISNETILTGPSLPIEVLERLPFYCEVQLNSRWLAPKLAAVPPSADSKAERQSA